LYPSPKSNATSNTLQLTPQLLKAALTQHLNELLKPIVAEYAADKDWQAIAEQAYPPEKAAVKVKKVKDKGDPAKRAAAAAARKGVVVQADSNLEVPEANKVDADPSTQETLQKLNITEC
jgi:tyrosyl-tRNA synthetase